MADKFPGLVSNEEVKGLVGNVQPNITIPTQASDEQSQGPLASSADVDKYLAEQVRVDKYTTPLQQAGAAFEGAVQGALPFGLGTAALKGIGLLSNKSEKEQDKDRLARAELNPGTRMASELTGFVGSELIPGVGAANLVGKVGKAASNLISGSNIISKVGSTAARLAAETAIIQTGTEADKMLLNDPHTSAQSAIVNIGASAALGGLLGGVGRAGLAAVGGSKLGATLDAIKSKVNGTAVASDAQKAAQTAGVELDPILTGALSSDAAKQSAEGLINSAGSAGNKVRDALKEARQNISNTMAESLGKPLDQVSPVSKYEAGEGIQQTLGKELKAQYEPVEAAYKPIEEQFSKIDVDKGAQAELGDRLNKLIAEGGYGLSADAPALKEINRVIRDVPNLKTLEDMRKYQSIIRDNLGPQQLFKLNGDIRGIFQDVEESLLDVHLGNKAPELVGLHQEAKAGYRALRNTLSDLNDRLHLGKFSGPQDFFTKLSEAAPEKILSRLSGSGDAGLLKILEEKFPQTAQAIKTSTIDSLLSKAAHSPGAQETGLNTGQLFRDLDKLSPELRDFAVPPETQQKLQALRDTLDALPKNQNPSGTSRGLDGLLSHFPAGAGGVIGLLAGGHGLAGALLGHLGKVLAKDVPEHAKVALLRFLGSPASTNPAAFEAMIKASIATAKGVKTTNNVIRDVFKKGSTDLIDPPSSKTLDQLDKHVKVAMLDPQRMLNGENDVSHYMPEYASASAMALGRVVNYLNQVRPGYDKAAPLDAPKVPTSFEKAVYTRALSIAEQPLIVMSHVKAGTLLPEDLQAMSMMYPELLDQMRSKCLEHVIEVTQNNEQLPYKTKMSLTLLLGQPLVSSMLPQDIAANQAIQSSPQQPAPQQGGKIPQSASKELKTGALAQQTPQPARQSDRQARS